MPTATEVDTRDLTQFEFSTPCIWAPEGCESEAVALYSRSHTLEGCWGEPVYMCQLHLTRSLRAYDDWLAGYGECEVCGQPIFGALSQNTRIVRI